MPKLDLVNATQIKSAAGEWLQAKGQGFTWAKPAPVSVPISTFYGTAPGDVPMDHKYAEGTQSGGNVTAVPNLGGAGAAFNLTTVGTVPVSGQAVDLDPSDSFPLASRANLVGTRLFIVADIRSTSADQYFSGQNENNGVGGKTNIYLSAGGASMRFFKNDGTAVSVDVPISPSVAPIIRLYEIELTLGGNITVFVNGQVRGSAANPYASFSVNRLAGGQFTTSGLNALLYRSLSLIQGGDYAARVNTIRARLNEQYGLGMYPVAPTLTGGSLTIA